MIAAAFDLVHELVQRATQRHVDLLQAAADREQRHAAVEAMADQGERGGVARRIVCGTFPALLAAVVMRLDIGRAAGQQHAVKRVEQAIKRLDGRLFVAPQLGTNCRNQYGQGADGIEPVLACIVETISERDRELLDELDRLVQEKKRELRRK